MEDSESVDDVEICNNCYKLMDENDKIVRDGSGIVAHMYPQECIRWQKRQIITLNERVDELERQYMVNVLPKP